MQVVAKKHHINIRGQIPESVVEFIVKKYGKKNVTVIDDDIIDITETEWYKNINTSDTPGARLKRTRVRFNLTQHKLAEEIGAYTQHISNMEKGIRPISVEMAKKFADFFGTDYRVFL